VERGAHAAFRIFAGATGRVARRTMLGDDGNQMQADGKFYPQISRMPQMKKKSVQSA